LNDKETNKYWQERTKKFSVNSKSIAEWRKEFYSSEKNLIGSMIIVGPSMQSNDNTFITNYPAESYQKKGMVANITQSNLIEMSIYLAVRQCIELTWINNSDHFLYPNKKWEKDKLFQTNCLTYAIFHRQNKISSKAGTNHWIPFTEDEVGAKQSFESNLMTKFIVGKYQDEEAEGIFKKKKATKKLPLEFSTEAKAVFSAGKALWTYYHKQPNCNVNASLYDIREYFQERNTTGKMNSKSTDEVYTKLLADLKDSLVLLAKKIEPRVYEYGFLK
jgi:hypothetical protein